MKNNIKKLIVGMIAVLGLLLVTSNAFASVSGIPVMSTNTATNISSTSATLNGYYNDNGSPMTSIFFDYGDSPLLGNNSPKGSISGDSKNYIVTVTGLKPATTYYFKAVGINGNGFGWANSAQTFTTTSVSSSLPVISTNPATDITSSSATLNGYFNSKNSTTQTYFEYGTSSSSLGYSTSPVTQSISYGNYPASISGLSANTKYYFRAVATNNAGTSYATSILNFTTVVGNNPPPTSNCSITNFDSDDYSVNDGDYVDLSWSTKNCSSANLSPEGSVSTNDNSYRVRIYDTTTFRLTTYGNNGSQDSDSFTVYVNSNPNPNPTTKKCIINYFNASTNSIRVGEPVTFSWSTSNCSYVNFGALGGGSFPLTGSRTEYPQTSTTYTLKASGNNGSDNESQYIKVTDSNCWINCSPIPPQPQPQPYPNMYQPQAVTTVVSSLKDTSAVIHGTVYTNGMTPTYAYFEYGTTSYLGNATAKYPIYSSSSAFAKTIYNLNPNTTYYFRLVAENSNGIAKGDIFYFKTAQTGTKIISPVVINYTKSTNNSDTSNTSDVNNGSNEKGSILGASAGSAGGTFLPSTAIGWMLLIIFILVLFLIVRYFVTRESPNQLHR